ncbi:MAG: hypothetical protein AAF675_09055, partial [Pseudomonadota bacterium]
MSGCCGSNVTFEGLSADYKRRLWIVIALNATMFVVEMTAGHLAGSKALQADERWSPFSEQSGGLATLEPVLLYAASSVPPRPVWASKGVRPPRAECGR